jgi:hypothetical protein
MKISLQFDSETKLGSLTLNGEEVENLSSLNVYKWGEEEMSVEIRTTEHEEDEKYKIVVPKGTVVNKFVCINYDSKYN